MLSVFTLSYNHEKFIAQAIDSALSQKTNFTYEIVIGDDASTDLTPRIVSEYANQHPHVIRPILHKKNLGPGNNVLSVFQKCRGKYIAFLEGDDFWSDTFKLQKQVDFLEANTDYTICFHNTEERYDNTERASWLYCKPTQKIDSTIYDLAYKNFIPTCSAVFRAGLFSELPDWFPKSKMGDWPIHLLNAKHGKIRYIPHVMGVHRIHDQGIWSPLSQEEMIAHICQTYDYLINHFSDDRALVEHLIAGKQKLTEQKKATGLLEKIRRIFN